MKLKCITSYFSVIFIVFGFTCFASEISLDEIISSIENMESSIVDVNIEYTWKIVPSYTFEEAETEFVPDIFGPVLLSKDGANNYKLCCSGFQIVPTSKKPILKGPEKWLFRDSTIIIEQGGQSWDIVDVAACDKDSYKKLSFSLSKGFNGFIDDADNHEPPLPFVLTPLGFSVFRTSITPDKSLLSVMLKNEAIVRLDGNIQKINDFNTVHIDILRQDTKQVHRRFFLSADHGYTPVRFEYWAGAKPEYNIIELTFDVESLEQVADGLWFPSAGVIRVPDTERVNLFYTTKPIKVNYGLTKENFQIKFPKGTEVHDKIKDKEYTVE